MSDIKTKIPIKKNKVLIDILVESSQTPCISSVNFRYEKSLFNMQGNVTNTGAIEFRDLEHFITPESFAAIKALPEGRGVAELVKVKTVSRKNGLFLSQATERNEKSPHSDIFYWREGKFQLLSFCESALLSHVLGYEGRNKRYAKFTLTIKPRPITI